MIHPGIVAAVVGYLLLVVAIGHWAGGRTRQRTQRRWMQDLRNAHHARRMTRPPRAAGRHHSP